MCCIDRVAGTVMAMKRCSDWAADDSRVMEDTTGCFLCMSDAAGPSNRCRTSPCGPTYIHNIAIVNDAYVNVCGPIVQDINCHDRSLRLESQRKQVEGRSQCPAQPRPKLQTLHPIENAIWPAAYSCDHGEG